MAFPSHSITTIKCRTYRESVRFAMEWPIDDFKTFQMQSKYMYSPGTTMAELGLKDDYEGRLCIRVKPCYQRTENEETFLSLYLTLAESEAHVQTIPVEFSARVTTGKTDPSIIWGDKQPHLHVFSSAAYNWGWKEAVSHDDLFGRGRRPGLLKDDCITVSMDVVVYKPPQTITLPRTVALTTGNDYQNFVTRQLNWFTAQQQRQSPHLDFILQSSDGKEFHTSRWILMAHSPVFAAMLKEGSLEQKESRCIMTDVDGETTEIMLNYLYGCSMHKINMGNVRKVLIMADKYEMMDLLHACEELLANNVTVDRAVHLLIVARQRGLEKLKTAALEVIPKNMATVMKNLAAEDTVQLQADPGLMQMIMEHCSKRMRPVGDP